MAEEFTELSLRRRMMIDGLCELGHFRPHAENAVDTLIRAAKAEAVEGDRQKSKAAVVRQSLMIVDLYYAGHREGWEPGESNDQILERAHCHLCNIGLDPYTNGGPEAIALLRERQQADDLDIARSLFPKESNGG